MDRKGDAMMLKIRNLDPILSNFENYCRISSWIREMKNLPFTKPSPNNI